MANTHSLDLELSSSQYASIADASQTGLDLNSDFTFECWVKLEQLPSTGGNLFILGGKYDSGANKRSYVVYLTSSDLMLVSYSSDGSSANRTEVDTDAAIVTAGDVGAWVHLAVSVDISTQTAVFYKNGSSVASTANTTAASTIYNSDVPFAIGASFNSGSPTFFYDGLIDDVRLWSDIRTPTEISANYLKELAGNESNLVGYWKLNNSYLDQTSNNNDLTASGSPVFSTDVPFIGATGAFFNFM